MKMVRINFEVEEKVRREFKLKTLERGEEMGEVLRNFINEYINSGGNSSSLENREEKLSRNSIRENERRNLFKRD